jgi:hypothetical protein
MYAHRFSITHSEDESDEMPCPVVVLHTPNLDDMAREAVASLDDA